MAIKVKNIATGEVKEVANTGLMDGKLFVFGKNEPTRWATKYEYFKLTGNILASGAYNKYEIEFVDGMGYELCALTPTRTRKATAKVAEPAQNSQVTPEPEPNSEPTPNPTAKVEPTPEPVTQNVKQVEITNSEDFEMVMQLMAMMKGLRQPQQVTAQVDEAQVRDIVKEEVAKQEPRVIEVKSKAGTAQISGVVSEHYNVHCNIVNAGKPLYLYGPAGCGKSYEAKQIAEGLKMDYYETSQAMFAHELKGYGDAKGEFIPTSFYRAFSGGGVFFLDEVDASAPEALVVLNNAIANKRFDFPVIGNIEAHPDFRVIAAGNTRMTGATMAYTARQMQDTSFKNRFFFDLVGYDERIEKEIAGGDMEIVEFAHDLRKAARTTQILQLCSYRQIEDLATLQECCGGDDAYLLRGSVLQEKEIDECNILYNALEHKQNRWAKAMKKCIEVMKNEDIW